ncbi:double-strand break repair helicase AddA [Terrihabitans soli]|uniref:DNA 3'-5' helicase n=1 Tax=Terrihabitans soli TaxID=708113 RepID=A0A6S6QZM4_9HYPH|nr:double-strand break repair helicase AddA [Terrihabitans soli]BCJ92118.1 double-strand break repair helicase AddA [Terrihabitans soli]
MSAFRPSEETKDRQRRASDPAASAWVSANAGSGKTYVLSNRVVRLLLQGHEPAGVLCITFTKAAAANMANTVFRRLAAWTSASDAELDTALIELGEASPSSEDRARARRLFARALDTPGGLKVLTIHGFCESLLHQFPFEAEVPAAFTVVDERVQSELVEQARADVLNLAAADPESALGHALTRLVTSTADMTLQRVLREVLMRGEELDRLMRSDGDANFSEVFRRLGLALGETATLTELDALILGAPGALAKRSDIVEWLRWGGKSDENLAACLARAGTGGDAETCRAAYLDVFLTKERNPRSDRAFVTRALRDERPDLFGLLIGERERLATLWQRRGAALAREKTESLLLLADAIRTRYRTEKARRGALDFADLIHAAGRLLTNVSSAFVHFKLDQGIDHVLVDEAQDTSPEQWAIVEGLTSEFTAGHGARAKTRTIFAVGDEKQSIFGFQGAAPDRFGEMRTHFERRHRDAEKNFSEVRLTQSFRTAKDVLDAVDHVFATDTARRGLTFDDEKTLHETARPDAPGRVEIWPLEKAEAGPDGVPWDAPFDEVSAKNPVAVLSDKIAEAVKDWTQGQNAIAPGEVLILVRQRGPLFEALLRKLKEKGLPVAGADRLDLGKHIAVLDMLALADALLFADNDLALASVLKSPLFELDDNDLISIAARRRGSLRNALRISEDARHRAAHDKLERFARLAAHKRPFDFYALVLGDGGGRRDFHRRLGFEVDDVLDEFLSYALNYGENETPTLAGFVSWMRAAPAIIKRDLETGGGNVRVMTVHGAKGLEAETVVLADIGLVRHASKVPLIFPVKETGAKEADAEIPVWSAGKDADPPLVSAARQDEAAREAGEHRRLLYVAMTRAKDRLVVAGHLNDPKKDTAPPDSWYALVREGLADKAQEIAVAGFDEPVLVYHPTPGTHAPKTAEAAAKPPAPPAWIFEKLPKEKPAPEWIAPSRAVAHDFAEAETLKLAISAKERGVLLHRLIETLPRYAGTEADAAARYLTNIAPDLPDSERTALAGEALAVLKEPAIAALLSAPGRSEVPVAGEIARPGRAPLFVSGQVDRLIVTADRVTVLDFKSDRPAPNKAPEGYITQLALYRALLRRIFSGKTIDCALVWTAGPKLEPIPQEALDVALERVLGMAPLP